MKIINFFGLKRSGNHCIHEWILKNFKEYNTQYFNCYETKRHYSTIKETTELLLCSFEDKKISSFIDHLKSNIDIVLLRDVYNWGASFKKMKSKHQMKSKHHMSFVELSNKIFSNWENYYHYIYNRINDHKTVYILYNNWVTDIKYRQHILQEICLKSQIKVENYIDFIDHVTHYGCGSSFDKRTFDGRASEMKVLKRWEYYKNDENYWKMFSPWIKHLNAKMFGAWLPDSKYIK